MKKSELVIGKKYLQKRNTIIDGVYRQAERWIKCENLTSSGAIFSREFEPRIRLTDAQIEREIFEQYEK